MPFYSQAWQDEFVINLLGFKKNGCFIDIGSGDGINQSNSYFFESEMGVERHLCRTRYPLHGMEGDARLGLVQVQSQE